MSKKLTAVAVFGLQTPWLTPLSYDEVVSRYEVALTTHKGFTISDASLERRYIPYEGLERIISIWEVTPQQQQQQGDMLKIPVNHG